MADWPDHPPWNDVGVTVQAPGPRLDRRLIEGIVFSRWFIITYQAAICGVLLLFTLWHWSLRFARKRRQQKTKLGQDGVTSSSASTLEGNSTPPERLKTPVTDEQSPLLHRSNAKVKPALLQRTIRAVRAVAMYQPRPIPLVKKALPSNATTLLVLLLLGLNVFYLAYRIILVRSLAFVFADRASLLFVANLPWLYLLAAKNQPIKLLTGYSYENLNILHRRLGELLCLLAVFHAVGMILTWYDILRPTGMDFGHFLALRIIWLGVAAFVSYEVLFFTSLASFRQWWYEVFLGSHVILQAAGLVFVFFHHHGGRIYTGLALGIFLVDRLVFRLGMQTRSIRANLNVMEDSETVLLSADWPIVGRWRNLWTSVAGLNTKYGWKPTEHVFLSVPAMARKHVIQAHPFTIASAAPVSNQQHGWFTLIIRAHSGFSRDLLHYARNHSSANVRLDGPHGSLHALEMLQHSDVALLVVGGSGIAVAYPLIWALLNDKDAEAARARKTVGLIWIIHEASHVSWIGHERLDELKAKGLHVCIPAPTAKAGRPDVGSLIEDTLEELIGGEQAIDPRVGVVVSGPDGMNRAARNRCASLAWRGRDIDVAVEKYGW